MQIVSLGDNLHEVSSFVSWKNKKNNLKCRLLKYVPSMQNVKCSVAIKQQLSND